MKTTIDPQNYRVLAEKKVYLKKWPTQVKSVYSSKKEYHHALRKQVKKTEPTAAPALRLEPLCRAADLPSDGHRRQGWAIRYVMSGVNP